MNKSICPAVAWGTLLIVLSGPFQADATDYTWQSGGGNSWQDGANWSGGSGADYPDDNADRAIFTTNGDTNPTINSSSLTVKGLVFNGNTNFTITGLGKDATTLRIDPNAPSTADAILMNAGGLTTQTFSNLTVNFDDSDDGGNMRFFINGGRQVVFDSTSRVRFTDRIRYQSTTGGVVSFHGDVEMIDAESLAQDNGAFTFNFNATSWTGSGIVHIGSATGSGTVTANLQNGVLGTGLLRIGGTNGVVQITNAGITTSNKPLTFNTGGANTGQGGTFGATYSSGTSTWSGTVTLSDPGSGARTNVLNVTNAGAKLVLANLVTGGDATLLTVQKTGAGVLDLSRAEGNDFTAAAFDVEAGTLLVNNASGSGTGSSGVTVKNGAVLGGTGILAPGSSNGIRVDAGGVIAPGNSIGSFRLDGGATSGALLTMDSQAEFDFELGAPGQNDMVEFWNYAGSSDFVRNNNAVNIADAGDLQAGIYTLFRFFLDDGITPTASSISSGLVLGDTPDGFAGFLQFDTNAISLVVTAIPEPSALALAALGVLGLLLRGRSALRI